jgi:hypothetical protein
MTSVYRVRGQRGGAIKRMECKYIAQNGNFKLLSFPFPDQTEKADLNISRKSKIKSLLVSP